ncbi:formate dehydrogenase accessory sulfurtransferase FdhD [Pannus brasiliensis CCIBt3594]|uniref:Sulfur carrier protein FdhD n=1 Tax=Pannus brasiliensis CCIBt3594 TaxID=1427578 RepID=A0AAW9QHZ0_9CHRO
MNHPASHTRSRVTIVEENGSRTRLDYLTTEEPLEIRLVEPKKTLAVTMRTPGADFDLVAGFLYGEGVIESRDQLVGMRYCVDLADGQQRENIINVSLGEETSRFLPSLERHFFTNSACGVCGKASLETIRVRNRVRRDDDRKVRAETLYSLGDKLRSAQGLFKITGGLHAAALFDMDGNLLRSREDVGRHNALDKLIGASFLAGELPLEGGIVMVSGRSSFEILQKCIVAGVPIVCSVSAPSSLAVTLAREFGVTSIGFLRGKKFNLYSGAERVIAS